ncbi:DNA primase [Aliiglaciecola sp. CAU 1673]|uniref:DNA primase n=1 Tax=Aliiglaciecola sp. CAU 1673 TaxID=3032595 RepID=UPI0023DB26DF|nr:DNA primase [Aliiglaciecola sp. CAU 1673]MDF2180070.1 DNA primase [Aliiglaciecola sp. CAU 1673]
MIPRDFIDDLLARTDIVELVDSRVRLKKAGRNYQACCPFHSEKSPSFTVSQDKQFYHCFGCGAHGNAISFLMEYDRLEFPEAVEELARHQGLEVPKEQGTKEDPGKKQQRQDDYQLLEQVARFFVHQLKHHAHGPKAVDYLKSRGLNKEVVQQFNIGYAPDDWDAVLAQFGRTPQTRQQLLDLKVATQNDKGRTYDFFRDRIMFPIRDRRGRVIGFGGRVLGDGSPKYLNSPETRIFHKGQELYGLYQVRQVRRRLERLMIVEGYMDVVALAQFGIDYAVASLGTATTAEQLQTLFRTAPQIVCCYDGDRAGREAAWRALENALPQLKDGVELKFLFLPDGEDPDTMVRKLGKEGFEQKLAEAKPLSSFFFDSLLSQHNIGSTEGKAALKAQALPLIRQIEGEHQRNLLEQELSKYTGEFEQQRRKQDLEQVNSRGKMQRADYNNPNRHRWTPVRLLIRLLLESPSLATQCKEVEPALLPASDLAGLDLLKEIHGFCSSKPGVQTVHLIEYFRDHPQKSAISKLLPMDLPIDDDNLRTLYQDSFAKLLDTFVQSRFEQLLSKSRLGTISVEEKQELNQLIKAG